MTMRLAKAFSGLLAVLAMSVFLAQGASAQGKPVGKPGKTKAVKAEKASPAPNPAAAASAEAASSADSEAVVIKRDPFVPLVSERKEAAAAQHLPPGKAGLVIAVVRVDGTVRSPGGMIAVVSNPEERVYFIREGDRLYDGNVEKIGLDGVTFRESSKDAFGKPVERVVTKRIYPIAGEQQ